MVVALMLVLQSTAYGPPAPARASTHAAVPAPPNRSCGSPQPANGEIIVCGRRNDENDRLRPVRDPHVAEVPVGGPGLGFRLGKSRLNLYSDSRQLPGAAPDKRVMVRLTMPF